MNAAGPPGAGTPRAVLVAGIGNVFHGDDGFGVEVVRRLEKRPLPPGVDVADFGLRCVDLMYALGDGYRAVVLVEAAERGHAPGTVSLVEPDGARGLGLLGTLDPAGVARESGRAPARVLHVACEPSPGAAATWEMGLSRPVAAAVEEAVRLVGRLAAEESGRLLAGTHA
ncbi:hydrogenase maturation protease [Actinomadura welshii]